ncbi:MAG: SpaA isopeptide-forming pilin-related protein [Ruminococcus sp.]|nr:SpaA isopeptide-forming pilin-related protein [Ruminococcus sp.]
MTAKKWYKRAAAMFTAFALMFILLPWAGGGISVAAAEKAVTLSNAKLLINGQPVTDSTKVKNGDEVFFSFDWSVNKGADEVLVNPLVADIDFQGIYLLATDGPLQQNDVNRGTYKIIRTSNGNKIQFWVDDSQLKESDIQGKAVFRGNISYTSDDVDRNGKVEIKATAGSKPVLDIHPNAEVQEKQANVWTDKTTDNGGVYKGSDGNYYQDYKVTVTSNSSSTADYTIKRVADSPLNASKSSFTGNIKATSSGSVTGLSSTYSNFGSIKNITLKPGASVTFKYTMKVDDSIIKNMWNTWEYGNKVVVDDMERYASPWVSSVFMPEVTKTGSLDEANHRIKWTVTMSYIDFTGNRSQDSSLVTGITDTLANDSKTGEALVPVGGALTADKFWAGASGKQITISDNSRTYKGYSYTYDYYTEYKDNGTAASRTFGNKFSANVDGFLKEPETWVTVPGKGIPVDKTFDGVDTDGSLKWSVTLKIPDSVTARNIVITDTVRADSGLSHNIVPGSINVAVDGVAAAFSESGGVIRINGDVTGEKTVTVTLKTQITDNSLKSGTYYNKARAEYIQVFPDGSTMDVPATEDEEGYTVSNCVKKSQDGSDYGKNKGGTSNENPGWFVNIDFTKLSGVTPRVGDKILIKDTAQLVDFEWGGRADIPVSGHDITIDKIYEVHTNGDSMYYTPADKEHNDYIGSNVKLLGGNTIEITVTQAMINDKGVSVYYTQPIPNVQMLDDGLYRVNNNVTVAYNGRDVGVADASSSPVWFVKGDILKKSNNTTGNTIHYTVEVNAPALNLGGEEDSIVLEDVMGKFLRFRENTLTVTDGSGVPLSNWSYTYDQTTRTLKVTLPDQTYCIVKYDAIADVSIQLDGTYKVNGNTVSIDEIKNSGNVTNTATLAGAGDFSESTSDIWAEADVSGGASIESRTGNLVVNKYDSLNNSLKLSGAEFSLVPGTFSGGEFSPYVNNAAHPSFSKTIIYDTGTESDTLIERLEFGILYQLTEITPPAKHKVFEKPRYIVIRRPGESEPDVGTIPADTVVEYFVDGDTIYISNEPSDGDEEETAVETEVNISKRAIGGSEELPGAKIRIVRVTGTADMSGGKITVSGGAGDVTKTASAIKFTSGTTPAVIKGLPAGEYRMIEDAAPAGYKKTTGISFRININDGGYTVTSGSVALADNTVVMEDELTSMGISKQNVFGEELPGASLTVTGTDASGRTVNFSALGTVSADNDTLRITSRSISFTSKDSPTTVYGLPEGSYILHEEAAPAGYTVTQDFPFTIDGAGNVLITADDGTTARPKDNTVILNDARTYVVIKKSDISGLPQIPGAVMEIIPSGGSVDLSKVDIYNGRNKIVSGGRLIFTTTANEAEIRGLPAGSYILSETAAPDGYEKVTSTFSFTLGEDGTVSRRSSDSDYDFDPVLHKIIMKDAVKEITPVIPGDDVTLGLSGLPIIKADMSNGAAQLPGARLTIYPDEDSASASVADAVAEYSKGDGTKEHITAAGNSLTFVTPNTTVYVSGLTVGKYTLVEETAPGGFEDNRTDFHFEVVIIDKTYKVVAGENNGYNVLTSDGRVVIRNYKENAEPDEGGYPDKDVQTEPTAKPTETEPTVTLNPADTTTAGGQDGTTATVTTVTTPGRPSYPTGPSYYPSRPSYPGNNPAPGIDNDPIFPFVTDKDGVPAESEDIKAGMYTVGDNEGSDGKDAAAGMAIVALAASAVYAVSKTLKRKRSRR